MVDIQYQTSSLITIAMVTCFLFNEVGKKFKFSKTPIVTIVMFHLRVYVTWLHLDRKK